MIVFTESMISYKDGLIWVTKDDPLAEDFKHIGRRIYKDQILLYPSDLVRQRPDILPKIAGLELLDKPKVKKEVNLRAYQEDIYRRWLEGGGRGVIIMPTGTGKTLMGIRVICHIVKPALCVVPTLVLVDQWLEKLSEFIDDVGEWTGRRKRLAPVTVATYDSASISAEFLGNKFEILVFDEVHHLPTENYRYIALMSVARYRMGLTATVERDDGLHELIRKLVGDFYSVEYKRVKDFLAPWEVKQIKIKMTSVDLKKYREHMDKYINFCIKNGLDPKEKSSFLKVIKMSSYLEEAREALLSHKAAKEISKGSEEKIKVLSELIRKHKGEKMLIFTDTQSMAYRISETFFIPCITSDIPLDERRKYLQGFSSGIYTAIVSAHVLDEGFDVPDASCAVIVSGSSSPREFIQRLGRILRPSKPRAIMYEIVTAGTSEIYSSRRRKSKIKLE